MSSYQFYKCIAVSTVAVNQPPNRLMLNRVKLSTQGNYSLLALGILSKYFYELRKIQKFVIVDAKKVVNYFDDNLWWKVHRAQSFFDKWDWNETGAAGIVALKEPLNIR